MKKYEIEIKEVLSRVEVLEAESVEDAIDKVMALYKQEEIVLDSADMQDVEFLFLEEKGRRI